ncbi:MAG: hypothetical protein A3H82_03785 [Candidatus Levybacteria bacterium RIFCSPLOWO2_02_FULL_39_26]|nr:MAG: hypothetical protein A3H82_03785 [Candidatus Levybacteria bacterium RIFCSPLOWO2_02_FULL_39_26]
MPGCLCASAKAMTTEGGVRSKKFEQISPKICRAGGIPPKPPFRPPAEATLSDWTILSFSRILKHLKKILPNILIRIIL